MYALTILQPWATAIALGPKRVENRSWPPPRAAVGQLMAIHAGKRWDGQAGLDAFAKRVYQPGAERLRAMPSDEYPMGAVIAVARLARVVTASDDPWFFGPYGWMLTEVQAIEPVPCRGAQGLWQLPPDVETQVMRALGESQLRMSIGRSCIK
jgi:hypothetical protein